MASTAEFLVERLENAGVKHVMALAGDYIFGFFEKLLESKKIELVNAADEAGAGFAADAYARMCGIGCIAVTYNVGALKLCNPVACAHAERSPVVVISGAPGVSERGDTPLHHMVGSFECQREVFKNITCAQAVLDNPSTAGYEIDRVFEALRHHKQPVYIELPRDVANKPINYDVYTLGTPSSPGTDMHNLEDALKEVASWIEESRSPVILAGVEVARFQLGKELIRFAERHNIPVACTLLGKSVVNELHPLFIGVYAGSNSSHNDVRETVENSDCLLVCGEVITEATVGYRPSKAFVKRQMVTSTVDQLTVRNHTYPNVLFLDFCRALFKTELTKRPVPHLPAKRVITEFVPRKETLTTIRLFEKINRILDEDSVVIADAGDSLFGASDLTTIHRENCFLGPAFYLSMGFAIPAAVGVKLACPKLRPIVIVGDGAFQMSLSEISTMLRWKMNPIILVLNNGGYTTERVILDGKFNNILNWNYHDVTKFMGGGTGMLARTEDELEVAINTAIGHKEELFVINCVVDSKDCSPALRRIADAFVKKVRA
jgi:indolepyruvate decarboxylase